MSHTNNNPVIICLTSNALPLARKIADTLKADIHGSTSRMGDEALDARFADLKDHLASLFLARRPIIGICASAILMRHLAPFLKDKWSEPPVIAIAASGKTVVPLLGGHHGGHELARRIAAFLKIDPAITTAGDDVLGQALDEIPPHWKALQADNLKTVMANRLEGQKIILQGKDRNKATWLHEICDLDESDSEAQALMISSAHDEIAQVLQSDQPVLVPQNLALGVGCARHCLADELITLVEDNLKANNLSPHAVRAIFSVDLKADEAALHALARHLDCPTRFFSPEELEAETPRLANPSDVVFDEIGCHGVAEAACLKAAGQKAELVIEKQKTANATMALARFEDQGVIHTLPGIPRGELSVIGIGPGQEMWRTPEATRAIHKADELVGYGLYLDLLGPLAHHKPRQDFPLGAETERCRYALEEAGKGRNIALICSGDSGIYAMGALVMELLDKPEDQGGVSEKAKRVAVTHMPGITALQAASARIGALIGHDFCAISLSDLLTPCEQIITRLEAAALGDFVIALYNPVSKRRRDLLTKARDILLTKRPKTTPVLLASNLGREDERLTPRTLETLEVDEVDMLTVVLIGASTSKSFTTGEGHWQAYTPRGYAKKFDPIQTVAPDNHQKESE